MTDNRTTELINDRVKRLLREAGADFTVKSLKMTGSMEPYDKFTVFDADKMPKARIEASFHNDETVLLMLRCTPEQAIAATLGSERTCHDVNTRFNAWVCSECKCTLLLMFDDYGEPSLAIDGVADVPKYCPNCGAKVVGE